MEKYDYDSDYEEEKPKFGKCPRCGQENRSLTWFIAGVKGTDRIVSGWVCNECYRKMKEGDDNDG